MSESEKREQPEDTGSGTKSPKSGRRVRRSSKRKARSSRAPLPPYHVILLDDNDHTHDYVIEMLGRVFGHPEERGLQMAEEVNATGRVIVLTTHKELAELKRDQILGYGADWRVEGSAGSMGAVIEPAEK